MLGSEIDKVPNPYMISIGFTWLLLVEFIAGVGISAFSQSLDTFEVFGAIYFATSALALFYVGIQLLKKGQTKMKLIILFPIMIGSWMFWTSFLIIPLIAKLELESEN